MFFKLINLYPNTLYSFLIPLNLFVHDITEVSACESKFRFDSHTLIPIIFRQNVSTKTFLIFKMIFYNDCRHYIMRGKTC